MKHFATDRFWRFYEALPEALRTLADKNFELLKSDSQHPSLHFKKVGRFWSARVGRSYRALAVQEGPRQLGRLASVRWVSQVTDVV